jgi:hypothetical protein
MRLPRDQAGGQEWKQLAPALKDTKVVAQACIFFSHENDWDFKFNPAQQTLPFRAHSALYNALHDETFCRFRAAHGGPVEVRLYLRHRTCWRAERPTC